jgi:hypothetical protein
LVLAAQELQQANVKLQRLEGILEQRDSAVLHLAAAAQGSAAADTAERAAHYQDAIKSWQQAHNDDAVAQQDILRLQKPARTCCIALYLAFQHSSCADDALHTLDKQGSCCGRALHDITAYSHIGHANMASGMQQQQGIQAGAPFEVGSTRFQEPHPQGGDVLDLEPWLPDIQISNSLAAASRVTKPGAAGLATCHLGDGAVCHGNAQVPLYSLTTDAIEFGSDRHPGEPDFLARGLQLAKRTAAAPPAPADA